ncbi:MAG: hypothetical protein WA770_10235, partial [Pseudolabrys sp.]
PRPCNPTAFSTTNRFCQRIRDQIMGSIVISGGSRPNRRFGPEIFGNKSRYVRNMTEGALFTA